MYDLIVPGVRSDPAFCILVLLILFYIIIRFSSGVQKAAMKINYPLL